ncbi:ORF6N domain-containing protein [Opitutaceae bacterium]
MNPDLTPLGPEEISIRILNVRGQRVLLDADLARIYGVPTKRLNEQVKRNVRRFPEDFVFRLTPEEAERISRLRSQNATLKKSQHIKHLPYVFTEHRAIQASNVLSSDAAIAMGVHVVRAFVRLRQWLGTQAAFSAKLTELESRIGAHDEQLAAVIEALRQLATSPDPTHDRKMGFHPGNR